MPLEVHSKMKRVKVNRTEGEIDFLEKKLKLMGRNNLRAYLGAELRKLAKEYNKCPGCITPAIGARKTKELQIDTEVYSALKALSTIMQKSIDSIIDDLLIVPLLQPGTV